MISTRHDASASPRAKSAFAAAFLSLLFPGLGQAYVGAPMRALGFGAPVVLFGALVGGIALRMDRGELFGLLLANLGPILLLDALLLVYRAVAIVDAWRLATYANAWDASGAGRLGPPRVLVNPVSMAGLAAVVLVMAGAHVVVARYDLSAMSLVNCVFDSSGTATGCEDAGADQSPGPSGTGQPEPTDSGPAASPQGTVGSPLPSQTPLPQWNGKDRLNILLVGVDQRPNEGTFNTDTMIVVSIDPPTGHVAMFSIPRDTVDVPTPPGRVQSVWPGTYPKKINAWFTDNRGRADLWPGPASQRGYTALKAILANLYGLPQIDYYVEVNFSGFEKVVDAVGGVTINVQNPVVDDRYPGDNGETRVYIPAGVQHMTGAQALIYARSRHGSDDFDRGARQQRVLLSLREQANPAALLPQLDTLINALKSAVHTDIPVSVLPQLLSLAEQVDTKDIRSYVFAPPLYASDTCNDPRGCVVYPKVAQIRSAVRTAFTANPADEAEREKLANEGAIVWVLNGSGTSGQAAKIASFLDYEGMQASAPNQRAPGAAPSQTRIVVYNGAETGLGDTIAYLEQLFGVQSTTATDPTIHADIVITTARSTPALTPPPLP